MHVIIRRSLCAAVFAGGLLALGTGAASAADQPIADTTSTVQGGASHTAPNGTKDLLGGLVDDVLGNGEVAVPVTVPVNVSGNAVGVLGDAVSDKSEAAGTTAVPAVKENSSLGSGQGGSHDGGANNGGGLLGGVVGDVLGNGEVAVPVTVPVNVSGNAVGVLGDAVSEKSEANGTTTVPAVEQNPSLGSGQSGSHDDGSSNGGGLLGGVVGDVLGKVQVALPFKVPVNVSGNAVGVLDNAVTSGSEAGNTVAPVTPVTPVTPLTPVIPVTPVAPATPVTPVAPVAPVNPATPVTPSTPVTPENPSAHVAPAAHVTPTATLNNVQAMSSGVQVLGSAAPHQLARTGSGLWPVYLSVLVLLAGLGLLLMARRFGYRTVA